MVACLKIKKIAEKGFPFSSFVRGTAPVIIKAVIVVAPMARFFLFQMRTFAYDFVKFATIEPDTAALGAIINFNAIAVCHYQGDVTCRTIHLNCFLNEVNRSIWRWPLPEVFGIEVIMV